VDPCEQASAPQLGFVAGLALHEAVESLIGIGVPRLALKWPNDLLLDGAKTSGLLLEGHRVGAASSLAIVIGFGVNIGLGAAGTPYRTTSLREFKADLQVEEVFAALSTSFARTFAAWRRAARLTPSDSFAAIRRLWLERAAGIGQPAAVRLPSGEKNGIFETVDSSGRLQLRTAAGLELIDAGDLYFPNLKYDNAGLAPARQGSDQ
jgi:BirA family biotin operon repressor/biotin-[acetyl-CoA-carboxylase] ligase